jgi:predicted aminopeptidase
VASGQVRLLLDREALDETRVAALDAGERRGVETLARARAFADAIGLEPSASHTRMVDRGDGPLVTIVVAAPVDRLEPVTWWFPITGRVPYLGFFDPARAEREAERLRAAGNDVWLRPAALYSSLGWFDDPVPRSLLSAEPIVLFETIVHERVHETVFVRGDVAYNEALATFVGHEATLAWLADRPGDRERARGRHAARLRFAGAVERLAVELEALYAGTAGHEAGTAREAVFARHRRELGDAPLSNAWVVAQRTYLGDLPCFGAELRALGGDLAAFVERHRGEPGRRDAACGPPDGSAR